MPKKISIKDQSELRAYLSTPEALMLPASKRREISRRLREAAQVVQWRLPVSTLETLGADGVRRILTQWCEAGAPLPLPDVEDTRASSWVMPPGVINALAAHAAAASKHTGKKWSIAQVVRRVLAEFRP